MDCDYLHLWLLCFTVWLLILLIIDESDSFGLLFQAFCLLIMFRKWLVIEISEAGRLGRLGLAQLFDRFRDMSFSD